MSGKRRNWFFFRNWQWNEHFSCVLRARLPLRLVESRASSRCHGTLYFGPAWSVRFGRAPAFAHKLHDPCRRSLLTPARCVLTVLPSPLFPTRWAWGGRVNSFSSAEAQAFSTSSLSHLCPWFAKSWESVVMAHQSSKSVHGNGMHGRMPFVLDEPCEGAQVP